MVVVFMDLFSENIVLKDWGTVYVGIKNQWLTSKKVIEYCEKEHILCSKERLVQLYLSYDDSLYSFLELIKKFVEDDNRPLISCNEDSNQNNTSCIPNVYWFFWEIEFLMRIIKSKKDKETKLHDVADMYMDFGHPESWHDFLYYMPPKKGQPMGIDALYENLQKYVTKSLRSL